MSDAAIALVLYVARRNRWLLAHAGQTADQRGEFREEEWM